MNRVMRKPSPGAGRFSKSMAGVCSLTVLRSSYASDGGWQPPCLKRTEIHRAAPNGASASDEKRRCRVLDERGYATRREMATSSWLGSPGRVARYRVPMGPDHDPPARDVSSGPRDAHAR